MKSIDPTNAADLRMLNGLARRKDWNPGPERCAKILDRVEWANDESYAIKDIGMVDKTANTFAAIYKISQTERHHEDKLMQAERHHQELMAKDKVEPGTIIQVVNVSQPLPVRPALPGKDEE